MDDRDDTAPKPTEVIARASDTTADLHRKIRIATILGTYQATLTHFPHLSEAWRTNCEQERLLGVSITGQWDCATVRCALTLRSLRQTAHELFTQNTSV